MYTLVYFDHNGELIKISVSDVDSLNAAYAAVGGESFNCLVRHHESGREFFRSRVRPDGSSVNM